jgi:hypothetical protein
MWTFRIFPVVAALLVLLGAAVTSMPIGAQESAAPAAPQTKTAPNSPQNNFVTALETFTKQIEDASRNVTGMAEVLDRTGKLTPETKRADVSAFREQLLKLEKQLVAEAPFPQAVERFDGWLVAQVLRLNGQRNAFTSQQDVEDLLAKYRAFQGQVAGARELIGAYKKDLVQLLHDISASETLAAEWLLVGEAERALGALNGALEGVKAVIDGIKAKLHELNLMAPRS